jgi:RNA polymerase sigma-70 factor (ECF subfamily)
VESSARASSLADAEDSIVAGRAADGDTAAFAVLVRRYTPMMRAYAGRILPGSAEVDDVVQDAFITAWQRLGELDDLAKVKSWLMRIVGRRSIDRLRAAKPSAELDSVAAEASAPAHAGPAKVAEANAEAAALAAVLQELPDEQRICWVLRSIGGNSYDEIATEMGLPVSTVRGILSRARKHIIVRMEEWR